jgi:hypothetical protein
LARGLPCERFTAALASRTSCITRGRGGWLDSSLKNVKQNDFNNEDAGSGCGEVKQNNFKIDDILDGFASAIIGDFESAVWAIFNNEVSGSGCGEQNDDILYGFVSAIIGGFESAVWAMLRVWSVVEAAVGKRSAQPFVEEQK